MIVSYARFELKYANEIMAILPFGADLQTLHCFITIQTRNITCSYETYRHKFILLAVLEKLLPHSWFVGQLVSSLNFPFTKPFATRSWKSAPMHL